MTKLSQYHTKCRFLRNLAMFLLRFRHFILCAGTAIFLAACSSDSSSSAENALPSEPIESNEPSSSSITSTPDLQTSSSSEETLFTSSSSETELKFSSSSSVSGDASSSSDVANIASSSNEATSSSSETAIPASSSSENISNESSSSESLYLWHDEFEGDAIDTDKWTFEIGTGASGWGNNEWEYYTDRKENAYVQDGILHIRANKEDFEGSKYTSARIITKGKFSFTYGTVEARIALPVGKGIWPAFWLLGQNIDAVSWPACGEIDIIETVNSENIVYGTNHWANGTEYATYGNNTGNYRDQKFELDVTQFHDYKFTWDEKYIRMFVDDFMYHEILIENNEGDTEEFHKPFFFILNVAVAGNWPGFEVDDSQFPNEMLVDYIRVSQ